MKLKQVRPITCAILLCSLNLLLWTSNALADKAGAGKGTRVTDSEQAGSTSSPSSGDMENLLLTQALDVKPLSQATPSDPALENSLDGQMMKEIPTVTKDIVPESVGKSGDVGKTDIPKEIQVDSDKIIKDILKDIQKVETPPSISREIATTVNENKKTEDDAATATSTDHVMAP